MNPLVPLAAEAQQPGKVYRIGFLRVSGGGRCRRLFMRRRVEWEQHNVIDKSDFVP